MFNKLVKSVKKDVKKTTGKGILTGKGHLGRIINPVSAFYYQLPAKTYRGLKNKTWSSNLLKYQGGGSRSSSGSSVGSVVAGARNARSIASLTTH